MSLLTHAATVWTGPTITYTQPGNDPTLPQNQDRLTDNVWLTRGGTHGLFNAKTESAFVPYFSPQDTEWADGTTADYASLTYTDWNTWVKDIHGGPPNVVGINAVLHLISEDIYLDVKFTSWPSGGGGLFAYERSTPGTVVPTPTVAITNPANGAVFAAPAKIRLSASAEVSGGSVTNVEFFSNGTSLGSVQNAPFDFITSDFAPGTYAFTAVATAAGLSATSSVVNVTVVAPIDISETVIGTANNQFTFSYSANPGLTYVIETSTDLINWLPVSTNVAESNPAQFSEALVPGGARFYRVGRLPNP